MTTAPPRIAESDLESAACPLCLSVDSKLVCYPKVLLPFAVKQCNKCGMEYLSPRLSELAMQACYRSDHYFKGEGYQDYTEQESALRATFRRLLRQLTNERSSEGRLLEIGCGHGYLLAEAAPYFYYRCGTDYSASALSHATPYAQRLVCGGLDDLPPEEKDFDCVIANHVIEHVYNPRVFVSNLLARLRSGGSLLLSTPNAGSVWRYLMGRRWPSYKLPEHIYYFDRHHLAGLMQSAGVETVTSVPYPHAFPLSLVASKIGIRVGSKLGRYTIWLPGTTVALAGRKPI